jgi:hypothetical protein
MDMTNVIALFGAMSLSVERIVEITKNIVPWLARTNPDSTHEFWRRASLQLLAVVAGSGIACAAQSQIQPLLSTIFTNEGQIDFVGCIVLGLLSSGGSGFWNQCLGIAEEFKKTKKAFRLKEEKDAQ